MLLSVENIDHGDDGDGDDHDDDEDKGDNNDDEEPLMLNTSVHHKILMKERI